MKALLSIWTQYSQLMMLVVFCSRRRCSTSKNHFSYFCNKNNEKYTSAINKDKLQYSDRKMATGYDPLWEVIMSINEFFSPTRLIKLLQMKAIKEFDMLTSFDDK